MSFDHLPGYLPQIESDDPLMNLSILDHIPPLFRFCPCLMSDALTKVAKQASDVAEDALMTNIHGLTIYQVCMAFTTAVNEFAASAEATDPPPILHS